LSFLAGGGGGSCCDCGVTGLEAAIEDEVLAGEEVVGVVVLVAAAVFLEEAVGGRGDEGAGLGEGPRSDRPKILDEALPRD